jgi:hypothetical protein
MRKSIKDDEVYGPIRAETCDAYIVAGKPKPERNWLYSRLVGVTLKNQELLCGSRSKMTRFTGQFHPVFVLHNCLRAVHSRLR